MTNAQWALVGQTFLALVTSGCGGHDSLGAGTCSDGGANLACSANDSGSAAGGTCSAVSPCGGTLDGTWQFASACLQGDAVAVLNAQLGMPSTCGVVVQSVSVNGSGTLAYADGEETPNMALTMTVSMVITQACASALAGITGVTLDASACANVQQSLGVGTSGTCTYANGVCNCVVSSTRTHATPTAYTTSETDIVYLDGTSPASYCTFNATLTEEGTSADLQGVTMIATFHRMGGTGSSTGNSDASPDTVPAGTCLLEYNDALAVGDPCCYRAGSANTCNKNAQCNSQSGADCCLIYATDSTSYGERCCLYANGGQVDGAAECAQLLAAK